MGVQALQIPPEHGDLLHSPQSTLAISIPQTIRLSPPEQSSSTRRLARVAVRVAVAALLLQLLGLVLCAKHVTHLLEPGMDLVARLFPDDWFVMGNILFGLFLILFAAAIYAAGVGIACAAAVELVRRLRRGQLNS